MSVLVPVCIGLEKQPSQEKKLWAAVTVRSTVHHQLRQLSQNLKEILSLNLPESNG